MKKIIWILGGILIGGYSVAKITKMRQKVTPQGLKSFAIDVAKNFQEFSDSVLVNMKERENDLKKALGLLDSELTRKEVRETVENPFSNK